MSDPVALALIATVAPTIAAVGAIVMAKTAASKAAKGIEEGQDRGRQNAAILKKQDELGEAVNGGLKQIKDELAHAKATILDLRAQLAAERGTGNK